MWFLIFKMCCVKLQFLSNAQKEEETERWAHDGNDDSGDENDDDVERK